MVMATLLWYIPALPLTGALLLLLLQGSLSRRAVQWIGCGSVLLAALLTGWMGVAMLQLPGAVLKQSLWNWITIGKWEVVLSVQLDALSLVFVFVITFVGTLIHIYSTEYMAGDPGYARFFAYMNLFVGAMLLLVMADDLLLLYLGWEGVGLCSYLLIGFWYQEPANGNAARKAFIVTRVGDTAFAIGLFLLFQHLGTLEIGRIQQSAAAHWTMGQPAVTAIALLLLGGAVGKSAQLPLQTWLPDAMAGPTPVSALIHAATMVTAGVYLIARMHGLFELAPFAQHAVAVVGAITLLMAGCSALVQTDIKRVLAYSTISQIGYMFLALGVGAWSAAVFHFMTHAFFKALLFLGAGAVIMAMHHEQDMRKMGGLRQQIPQVYVVFLIGSAALAALPFVTAGFYSKDQILWVAWQGERGQTGLWLAGLAGAFLTALYTFRMVYLIFWGTARQQAIAHRPAAAMMVPLYLLAFLSLTGGFIEMPHNLAPVSLFSTWVQQVLPPAHVHTASQLREWWAQGMSIVLVLAGWGTAYLCFVKRAGFYEKLVQSGGWHFLKRWWLQGWGFDGLYDVLLVRPFVALANINRKDVVDLFYSGLVIFTEYIHHQLIRLQSGLLRWYVMGFLLGAVLMLILILLS